MLQNHLPEPVKEQFSYLHELISLLTHEPYGPRPHDSCDPLAGE